MTEIAVLETTASGVGAALALAAEVEPGLHEGADVALCLDPEALVRAASANVPFRIAVFPTFDVSNAFEFAGAHAAFVAHDRLVPHWPGREGLANVHSIGPIAPIGWREADDADVARKEQGFEGAVVLVPGHLVEEAGMTLLLQLSLVAAPVSWLFDVGHDPELASHLRKFVPPHDLDASIFARGEDSTHWDLAHCALSKPRDVDVVRALSVGSGVVTLPDTSGRDAARALEASGVGTPCDALETLAVAIDMALGRADVASQAARDLDVGGSAGRAITLAKRIATEGVSAPAAGLPVGLERLPREARGAAPPSAPPGKRSEPAEDADLESQIDAELAALKKKL